MNLAKRRIVWLLVIAGLAVPVVAAMFSPFLQWRSATYIAAGFAGIIGLALLAVQPVLVGNLLPGCTPVMNRKIHRYVGGGLCALVFGHVFGLWLESPPDVIDVLLFRSPTPFAVWGAVAMWAVFLTGLLALLRKKLQLSPTVWRIVHKSLALVIVVGSVVHAYLVLGAMEPVTKALLCIVTVLLAFKIVFNIRLKRLTGALSG